MNNDSLRRTFIKFSHSSIDTSQKKKSFRMVKLPSVRLNLPESELGQGGYAKVRLCTRRTDQLPLVVKIFPKFRLNTEQKKKSVLREIEIMKCIKHPSIIKIVDSFQNNQTINIVMQHFSTTTLADYTKHNRPLSDVTTRSIVKQIAQALSYLHRIKIAHRDIKPENILINQQHQIKIIDLGLSMMGEHSQTKVAGTPYYMSPELLKEKSYDPFKADVWAFGILIYWLVLGYFPHDNTSPKKKKSHKPFQLHFPIDMHPGIQYLISKMLEEQPSERIRAEQVLVDTWVQPKDFKSQISKLLMKNMSKQQ